MIFGSLPDYPLKSWNYKFYNTKTPYGSNKLDFGL